jgi:hypothetical protein
MKMSADLLDLLAVIRTELLDPQWGQHRSDVVKPTKGEAPRIIAEKIGRTLQSIVSGDIPVLQRSLALGR